MRFFYLFSFAVFFDQSQQTYLITAPKWIETNTEIHIVSWRPTEKSISVLVIDPSLFRLQQEDLSSQLTMLTGIGFDQQIEVGSLPSEYTAQTTWTVFEPHRLETNVNLSWMTRSGLWWRTVLADGAKYRQFAVEDYINVVPVDSDDNGSESSVSQLQPEPLQSREFQQLVNQYFVSPEMSNARLSIAVVNTTPVPRTASRFAAMLTAVGAEIINVSSANPEIEQSRIVLSADLSPDDPRIQQLIKYFPIAITPEIDPEISDYYRSEVVVLLGKDAGELVNRVF